MFWQTKRKVVKMADRYNNYSRFTYSVAPYRASAYRANHARKPLRTILFGVIALLFVSFFAWSLINGLPSSMLTRDIMPPSSTPQSEWQAGQVPYLYQTDPQWADESYSSGTVAENACGPMSLAMVYAYFKGSDAYSPLDMCAFAEKNGYAVDGATSWSFMSEGAEMLGLNGKQLALDKGRVVNELQAGHPIVCIMGPGDFTRSGHFIVLAGINDDGTIQVHDSNSSVRSNTKWDLETILGQCQGLWVYSW